jgi:hypothetical protein
MRNPEIQEELIREYLSEFQASEKLDEKGSGPQLSLVYEEGRRKRRDLQKHQVAYQRPTLGQPI